MINISQHKQMNIDCLKRIIDKIEKADTKKRISYCLDVCISGAKAGKRLLK